MMSHTLRVFLLIFSIVLFVTTFVVVKRGRMPIKYSLLWFFSAFIVLVVAIFPVLVEVVANCLGFITISNLIIGIIIALLLFLTMSLTIISAGQNKKIVLLIQEISILKESCSKNNR